ncbi:MAG: pirin family protein [Anaerolineae bacterium]|nr:MAG: pirin family protein [Anaerolineae bacterium]
MRLRGVIQSIEPQAVVEGAGVRLKRSIATRTLDYLDPFLLFDHFGSDDPADYRAGFPLHPHRGIETVTYMLAGVVNHKDSLGNAGSIGAGDVQWMTSGRGILHEEMPQPRQGQMEGFQLWVNLPAKLKMTWPRYQEIPTARIPEVERLDGIRIRVVAGTVEGVRGPVTEIAADPSYLDVSIPPHGSFIHPIERGHTAFAYVFEGQGRLGITAEGDGATVARPKLLVFDDGDAIKVSTAEQSLRFLLVSGQPLHEPIARYGPFVMNTVEEIEQALRDLRDGTFVQ